MGQPGAKWHIGTFSTPEEAALHVARARAQELLNDPLLCREEPEELTTGLSGTAVLLQQASVAARPAELTTGSSGTASSVQQASELNASGTASSVQQASDAAAPSDTTASVPAAADYSASAFAANATPARAQSEKVISVHLRSVQRPHPTLNH